MTIQFLRDIHLEVELDPILPQLFLNLSYLVKNFVLIESRETVVCSNR